jgi:hypothetical protein
VQDNPATAKNGSTTILAALAERSYHLTRTRDPSSHHRIVGETPLSSWRDILHGEDMTALEQTAPAFVELAHRIVWCTVATVDRTGRPRSRILHPYWSWDGAELVGWVGTMATPTKRAHLDHSPYASCSYWDATHDAGVAECRAELVFDDTTRTRVWNLFKNAPEPLGYDPGAIGVPGWDSPTSAAFAVLRLRPWRVRVFPGSITRGEGGTILTWRE